MKRKRPEEYLTARIEEILPGQLAASVEGTKFLLDGQTCFFRGESQKTTRASNFRFILKYFFHFYGKVNYLNSPDIEWNCFRVIFSRGRN